jgi:hypothetical protein
MKSAGSTKHGGSAPATPGFNAVAPECVIFYAAAAAAPVIPAAESTLGSHPCVALSSAQVLPEWINRNPAVQGIPANGDNPLNFVSHARGSLHLAAPPLPHPRKLHAGSLGCDRDELYVVSEFVELRYEPLPSSIQRSRSLERIHIPHT